MNPDLALGYCRMIAQTLALDAAGVDQLLAGTGLDAAAFYDSEGFLDWPGVQRLIANARTLDARPDLALRVGQKVLPAMHGAIGMAIMVSANLRDAMQLFMRFNNTRTRLFHSQVEEQGDHLRLRLTFAYPQDDAVRFLTDAALASAYACQLAMSGRAIEGSQVHFNYPAPAHVASYSAFFAGAQIVFGAPSVCMSMPARFGDLPLPGHDDKLLWMAVERCESRLRELSRAGCFSDRVVTLLRQDSGLMSEAACATLLHVSPRTLIRRLKQEGVSFQQLRDQSLAGRAVQLLSRTDYTVEAVADALGYSDVASFRRAFARWFGTNPAAFRQSLR